MPDHQDNRIAYGRASDNSLTLPKAPTWSFHDLSTMPAMMAANMRPCGVDKSKAGPFIAITDSREATGSISECSRSSMLRPHHDASVTSCSVPEGFGALRRAVPQLAEAARCPQSVPLRVYPASVLCRHPDTGCCGTRRFKLVPMRKTCCGSMGIAQRARGQVEMSSR